MQQGDTLNSSSAAFVFVLNFRELLENQEIQTASVMCASLSLLFLFCLGQLLVYFGFKLCLSFACSTHFHLSGLQHDYQHDRHNDQAANVKPEIVFFFFHLSYLKKNVERQRPKDVY